MDNKARKAKVRELLERRDLDGLVKWAASTRNPQRILFSLTFDKNELIQWRAIEAIGRVAQVQAESDIEKVRDFIRRLLWLMNDESGGLGWRSPEMIGEILVNVPVLASEYAGSLPAFLREEPFERGTHFAIYRVASVNSELFAESISELGNSLENSDPLIRGYAVLALGAIGAKSCHSAIEKIREDRSRITMYNLDTDHLQETTVALVVKKVLEHIGSAGQAA